MCELAGFRQNGPNFVQLFEALFDSKPSFVFSLSLVPQKTFWSHVRTPASTPLTVSGGNVDMNYTELNLPDLNEDMQGHEINSWETSRILADTDSCQQDFAKLTGSSSVSKSKPMSYESLGKRSKKYSSGLELTIMLPASSYWNWKRWLPNGPLPWFTRRDSLSIGSRMLDASMALPKSFHLLWLASGSTRTLNFCAASKFAALIPQDSSSAT